MLIKSADDKSKRLTLLEDLQKSSLLETKNCAGNLEVNQYGEFTAIYDEDRFGIPSPLEQSKRHERVLARLMETLGMVGRTEKKLSFHHVVMLHPKAIITRPDPKAFDTSFLVKADQFPAWREKYVESMGVGSVFKVMLNMRSLDTIKEWGEKLKRQHCPANLLTLPDFMQPKPQVAQTAQSPQPVAPASVATSAAAPVEADASLSKKFISAYFSQGAVCRKQR